jgi:cytochrome c oxidase subunit 4
MMNEKKNKALRQGIWVFVGLALLTGIEYIVGINGGWLPAMIVLALIKAVLVVWYYMHIMRAFNPESGDHE